MRAELLKISPARIRIPQHCCASAVKAFRFFRSKGLYPSPLDDGAVPPIGLYRFINVFAVSVTNLFKEPAV